MSNKNKPQMTMDDVREAWVVWSAWKRIPTQGREASETEFDSLLEGHDDEIREDGRLDGMASADLDAQYGAGA